MLSVVVRFLFKQLKVQNFKNVKLLKEKRKIIADMHYTNNNKIRFLNLNITIGSNCFLKSLICILILK
jgi:hypothetical protein